MVELMYEEDTYKILGACMEVYKVMGNGFLESVYQESLKFELKSRDIDFIEQPELEITYKGTVLQQTYKPDFICYGKIVLELKAVSKLTDEHRAQLHNYLKATGCKLGLLVNFGHYPLIEKERIVR